jgi:probable HAF family extracellular repeat protein
MRFCRSFRLEWRARAMGVTTAVWVAGAGAWAAGPQSYTIRELGTLGGTFDQPLGINAAGQVVGNSNPPGDQFYHAVLFTAGAPTDLGTFGGTLSTATAINDAGQIVGFAYVAGDQNEHAFLTSGGALEDLGAFGTVGPLNSSALAINNAGQIVGWAGLPDGSAHAFLYQDGQMQDLGTLGGVDSQATGINQAGVICGQSVARGGTSAPAFIDRDGVMTSLGTLGGPQSYATAINDAGQVVGWADTIAATHAFLDSDGRLQDLGTLGGATSRANGINDASQVVGAATPAGTKSTHAALWENGVIKDLNALIPAGSGWLLDEAYKINGAGQIIGTGFFQGAERPFLLTPVTP